MKIQIAAARLFAAGFLALGFGLGGIGGTLLTAVPASAQETYQETPQERPWYLPQPWVHPPQTGPKIRKLPGYYGHTYGNRSYGGFANYCYGECGYWAPGTVHSSGGVILSQPVVAMFDPRDYLIVPRAAIVVQQEYAAPTAQPQPEFQRPAPARYVIRSAQKPMPKFSVQNGVRIIRPVPATEY